LTNPIKKPAPLLCLICLFLAPLPLLAAESKNFWGLQFEELEYRYGYDSMDSSGIWGGDIFYGTDELKFRWLTNGEYENKSSSFHALGNEFVIQIPVTDFFDAKAGLRFDTPEGGENRSYAVFGITGLAPQWFELDINFLIGEQGNISAGIDSQYELLLTNRLILTPSLVADIAFYDDPEIGVGSGLTNSEIGLRLGYDVIDRAVSPYIGVFQENAHGKTADLVNLKGGRLGQMYFSLGAKIIY